MLQKWALSLVPSFGGGAMVRRNDRRFFRSEAFWDGFVTALLSPILLFTDAFHRTSRRPVVGLDRVWRDVGHFIARAARARQS
jgi:hypothetical protein